LSLVLFPAHQISLVSDAPAVDFTIFKVSVEDLAVEGHYMRKSIQKIFIFRKGRKTKKDASLEGNSSSPALQLTLSESATGQSAKEESRPSSEGNSHNTLDLLCPSKPTQPAFPSATTVSSHSTAHRAGIEMETSEKANEVPDELLGSTIASGIGDKPHSVSIQSPESSGFHDETEAPHLVQSYNQIPVLEQTRLPRGGVSIETQAAGRVQVREWLQYDFMWN
jgi:hypothetical protein